MGVLWRAVDQLLNADPHAPRRLSELRGLLAAEDHPAIRYALEGDRRHV